MNKEQEIRYKLWEQISKHTQIVVSDPEDASNAATASTQITVEAIKEALEWVEKNFDMDENGYFCINKYHTQISNKYYLTRDELVKEFMNQATTER